MSELEEKYQVLIKKIDVIFQEQIRSESLQKVAVEFAKEIKRLSDILKDDAHQNSDLGVNEIQQFLILLDGLGKNRGFYEKSLQEMQQLLHSVSACKDHFQHQNLKHIDSLYRFFSLDPKIEYVDDSSVEKPDKGPSS